MMMHADSQYFSDEQSEDQLNPISQWMRKSQHRMLQTYLTDAELEDIGLTVSAVSKSWNRWTDFGNVTYVNFEEKTGRDNSPWLVHRSAKEETGRQHRHQWLGSLEQRIDDLRAIAIDEQLVFDEASASAALSFVNRLHDVRRPGAFLVDGNIRLVWDKPEGQQVGLQFRGSSKIQFVIFQVDGNDLGSLMGLRSNDAVLSMVTAAGIFPLIANG